MVNNGSAGVTVTQFVVNDGEFTVSGISLPLTLNSKQTATGTIIFTPSKTGAISASVSANSSSGPLGSLSLIGTGLGVLAHSADVSWTMSSTPGVVSYNIYRSSVSGGPYAKVGNSAGTIFTDSTLQAGQTYFYVVTAVDGSSTESVVSAEVSTSISSP